MGFDSLNADVCKAKLKSAELLNQFGDITVSLKLMNQSQGSNGKLITEAFFHEVCIMGILPISPNLQQFIGYSYPTMAIATKYYSHSLGNRLFHKDFPYSMSLHAKIALDVSNGLVYLHRAGIIHLDLSPSKSSNIRFSY